MIEFRTKMLRCGDHWSDWATSDDGLARRGVLPEGIEPIPVTT